MAGAAPMGGQQPAYPPQGGYPGQQQQQQPGFPPQQGGPKPPYVRSTDWLLRNTDPFSACSRCISTVSRRSSKKQQ